MRRPRDLLIAGLFVLALRVPFLNQAVQGDDAYYLAEAEHAQVEPWHPKHTEYVFLGRTVDMRGQPHPPLNAWYLALLLAAYKDISEVPFHAAYILFSLIAAFSALSLARRFSPHPLLATLLFLVTPAFVVNGNSLESDLPLVAFWLLAAALYITAVDRRSPLWLGASALAMALAAMAAYQAVFLALILFLYDRQWGGKWRAAALATLTAPVTLGAWQLFERWSTGAVPAMVLANYLNSWGFEAFTQKLRSAAALTGHLAWIVFPGLLLPSLWTLPVAIGAAFYDLNPLFWASIAVGAGILLWCVRNWRDFLSQWVLIFFAGAVLIFFAGSARYLLPLALPLAILATRRSGVRLAAAGVVCGLGLSIALAIVNYQHASGYRDFARSLEPEAESRRVWINGEWGLRYYLEALGALPLLAGQTVHPGDLIVTSALGYPVPVAIEGGVLAPIAQRNIGSKIPLRLIALHGPSAYSTTSFGLRPFDFSRGTIDQVRAEQVVERKPALSFLPMDAPEAEQQIVSGVYALEGRTRWMARTAVILLKPPPQPAPLVLRFYIPDTAPARRVTVTLNDQPVATQAYTQGGSYVLTSVPESPGDAAKVAITVDKTFSTQSDRRELGLILLSVGFESH